VGVAENKALVLRFYEEVWGLGNLEFAHEVFADEYVRHDLRPSEPPPGPEGQAKIAGNFRSAFPDLEWHVDLMLGDGDLVAARWTAVGTHSGAWGEVAATGERVSFSGVNIFRFGGAGKVVEIWNHRDDLGLMEQLGASVVAGAVPSAVNEPA
jgi:predicted ester cyclase